MSTPFAIKESIVVLVEGKDDKRLVEDLLKIEGISKGLQVVDLVGVDKIPALLETLKRDAGVGTLKKLALVVDADRNPAQMQKDIDKALRKASLPKQISVSTLIVPSTGEGMLEDVCMGSVLSDPVMSCVESFLACIQPHVAELPRNASKSRFLAFMASRPKATNGTIEAALQKGYFDLSHPAFNEIRVFLKNLAV